MRLHLVAGFLGSGKTTAIAAAAQRLMAAGRRVGVVTNDQGKYLVDTLFLRAAHVPTVEVTGGCFCCNYDDLEARLRSLEASARPDVIFAESVGSCADLVATVVKPLLDLAHAAVRPASFSVYADSRLLYRRLAGDALPFSDTLLYLFDQQIAEAGLLVVNKIDLLPPQDAPLLTDLARAAFPDKPFLLQNARSPDGVAAWLTAVEAGGAPLPEQTADLDYAAYTAAEQTLAWLDAVLEIRPAPGGLDGTVRTLLDAFIAHIRTAGWPVGHVKFLVRAGNVNAKLGVAALPTPGWMDDLPPLPGDYARVTVNARVATAPHLLEAALRTAIAAMRGATLDLVALDAFEPAAPVPQHRYP